MSAPPACPAALLQQALDIYRQPLRYRKLWAGPGYALPDGVGGLLDLAAAPPEALDGPAARLHASREELSAAIHFFIRQVLLAEENDAYRVLGLTPAATPEQIKSHYRKLMRLYHPDRGVGREWGGVYAPRINQAYGALRPPEGRAARRPAGAGLPPPAARRGPGKARPGRRLAARLKSLLPGRRPAARRPGWPGLAASAAAVAAGVGFIAWNLLTWSEPAQWAPPPGGAAWAPPPPPEPPPLDWPDSAAIRHSAAPAHEAPPKAPPTQAWRQDPAPHPAGGRRRPPPGAAPAPAGLSEQELNARVLNRLAAAFRQGDLNAFIALFSEQAVSNRQPDREGIRREYAELFANTTQRELRLGNFHWQIDDQAAIGKGTFNLKLSTLEQNAQPSYEGILVLDVGREAGAPLIKGFFQSYREAP